MSNLSQHSMRVRLQATLWPVGFFLGWLWLGRMPFPAMEAGNGFLWSTVLLMVFVWLSPSSVGLRYLVRALFVVAVGALLLWERRTELVGSTHLRNLLAFFFLGLGLWSILERSAQQVKLPSLVLLPLFSVASLYVFLQSHHIGQGILSGSVVLQLLLMSLVFVISVLRAELISAAAVLPFVSIFSVAFMAGAHFYFNVNPWTLMFFCIPFAVLWARGWLVFIPRSGLVEVAVLGVIAAMPLAYFFWH